MKTPKVPATKSVRNSATEDDEFPEDSLHEQISMRPDGYYWQAPDGKQEVGPFKSLDLALADMAAADEQVPEPGETLQEAEDEIGIANWIDPDTGEPAEGQARPRFADE